MHWRTQLRGTQPPWSERHTEESKRRLSSRVIAEQDPTPQPRVSYGRSSASGVRPSATTIVDQRTGTSDVARAGSEEHDDDDVAMDGDGADDDRTRHPQTRRDQTAEGGSRRRGNRVKSELSNQAPLNSTFHCDLGVRSAREEMRHYWKQ